MPRMTAAPWVIPVMGAEMNRILLGNECDRAEQTRVRYDCLLFDQGITYWTIVVENELGKRAVRSSTTLPKPLVMICRFSNTGTTDLRVRMFVIFIAAFSEPKAGRGPRQHLVSRARWALHKLSGLRF